jgi:glycolate dehydrogenase FAD-binding subunit
VLAEMTFKVFPRPASLLTMKTPVDGPAAAAFLLVQASRTRWELDALDAAPMQGEVYMRLGGPAEANEALAAETHAEVLSNAEAWWSGVTEFAWAPAEDVLVKVPITPSKIAPICDGLPSGARVHVTAGGNAAWLSLPGAGVPAFDAKLRDLQLSGLVLRGGAPLKLGHWPATAVADRVKAVLDPVNRFPPL